MSLTDSIRKDMFEEVKKGNTTGADIFKLVLADIKNEEIALDKDLTDEEIVTVLRRREKKSKDSISEFSKIGRDELVKRETEQLETLQRYLPQLMSDEEIELVVKKVINEKSVTSIQGMGLVMGMVMKELSGKADGNTVKSIVEKLLSK
ncbi:MAG TPA: GatB/YqeY domain-containing protein [Candidatus Dojkabacteria bacterium]|nr:GatB/YqeY domain-containing protein [Candidatus Dojkabacteria bacterium]